MSETVLYTMKCLLFIKIYHASFLNGLNKKTKKEKITGSSEGKKIKWKKEKKRKSMHKRIERLTSCDVVTEYHTTYTRLLIAD